MRGRDRGRYPLRGAPWRAPGRKRRALRPFGNLRTGAAVDAVRLQATTAGAKSTGVPGADAVRLLTATGATKSTQAAAAATLRLLTDATGTGFPQSAASASVRLQDSAVGGKATQGSAVEVVRFQAAATGTQSSSGGGGIAGARFGRERGRMPLRGPAWRPKTKRRRLIVGPLSVQFGSSASVANVAFTTSTGAAVKGALASHEELSASPPFTIIVDGARDRVTLRTTATGVATLTRGGPAAATVRLVTQPAGSKGVSAPAAATVRLATQATGTQQTAASGAASATVRFATAAAGSKSTTAVAASTARATTTATGRKATTGPGAATTRLTPAVAGRKGGLGAAGATARYLTQATGTQIQVASGASSTTIHLTATAQGRKGGTAPIQGLVRLTVQATAGAPDRRAAIALTLALNASCTGGKATQASGAVTFVMQDRARGIVGVPAAITLDEIPAGRHSNPRAGNAKREGVVLQ